MVVSLSACITLFFGQSRKLCMIYSFGSKQYLKGYKNITWTFFSVTRRSWSDVSYWVTELTLADFTDVTLVSKDAVQRLDWCDSGDHDDWDENEDEDDGDDEDEDEEEDEDENEDDESWRWWWWKRRWRC